MQRSCGCLSKAAFKRIQRQRIETLSAEERASIFEAAELMGCPDKAAATCGVDRYLVSFVWQAECQRLEALPTSELQRVHRLANKHSTKKVLAEIQYTKAERLRICRIWEARKRSGEAAFAALSERLVNGAPAASPTGNLLGDAKCYIRWAVELLQENHWDRRTYPREFSSNELGTTSNPKGFRWIYEVLDAMPNDLIAPCFGDDGIKFLRACKYTLRNRTARRRNHAGRSTVEPVKRHVVRLRKARPNDDFGLHIARPSMPSSDIAQLFTDIVRMKTAA